ncbi:MAG: efflux RND transporter periplasmic adaptor subunit [Candidatus Pacebacteria bacterium]|nr:efflux RND transporter periplasmic adaptor subunit [Candidatus Paceibacterota bacterium]
MYSIKSIMNKTKKIILGISIFAVILIIFFIFRSNNGNNYQAIKVVKGSLSEEVIVTGKTAPLKETNLGFETAGKINNIYVKVGDEVYAGQLLAEIDKTGLYADLAESEAGLNIENLKLANILSGAKSEEIGVQEAKVSSAEINLRTSKENLISSIYNSYTTTDDSVRNKLDSLYTNPKDGSPKFNISVSDSQLKINLESGRFEIEGLLNLFLKKINILTSYSEIEGYYSDGKIILEKAKSLLDNAGIAVNNTTANGSLSADTLATYKSNISTARTNVNTAMASLNSFIQSYESTKSTLDIEQKTLALKKSSGSPEEIGIQKASIDQTKAKIQSIKAKITKASIRSPISGKITKKNAEVGEIASVNNSVLTVHSDGGLIIEANIPETDIGKVNIGNIVNFTMDAFDKEKFTAKIYEVEPGETIVDGVVNFKIKAQFDAYDPRIKSGLTSNLRIETLKKDGILIIPQYAVMEKSDGSYVKKMINGKISEAKIETGIRGTSGLVEILSGLSDGEEILVSKTEK